MSEGDSFPVDIDGNQEQVESGLKASGLEQVFCVCIPAASLVIPVDTL